LEEKNRSERTGLRAGETKSETGSVQTGLSSLSQMLGRLCRVTDTGGGSIEKAAVHQIDVDLETRVK
jgi:hypothetical protein